MHHTTSRRGEERLRYHWPIWYTDAYDHQGSQGQMVDVSSQAAAFTCYIGEFCPHEHEEISTHFSVPQYGPDNSFQLADFIRTASVYRVERVSDTMNRVVLQFHEPLHFKPGEQMTFTPQTQVSQEAIPA